MKTENRYGQIYVTNVYTVKTKISGISCGFFFIFIFFFFGWKKITVCIFFDSQSRKSETLHFFKAQRARFSQVDSKDPNKTA